MFTLFNHQKTALNYLRLNDSFILTMEQGTGKTLPSLCRILELLKSNAINNALIVCPKSVIGSWYRDMELFNKTDRSILLNKVDVINYDSVWRNAKYNRDYDLILLDEAHSIANRQSKRAKFLLRLSVKATYRYLLTGTPISNGRLEDSWSLICFLDPVTINKQVYSNIWREYTGNKGSFYDWCGRYAFLDQYHKPYKYKRVEEIQLVLKSYSYCVKKVDCLDLPEKLPDEIRLLNLAEPTLYKEMAKHSTSSELEIVADNPLTKLLYLRQIASGCFSPSNKTSKESALEDLLLEIGTKKLVIFAEFTASITQIKKVLVKNNISFTTLDGNSDKNNWRLFQQDATIQVIICQYQSGCQGIDLFTADTTLYYEPTLRSNVLEQSRDRIHRQGQRNVCSYIHFITKGTVEEQIYKALANYSDFNQKLFNEYVSEYQRSFRR